MKRRIGPWLAALLFVAVVCGLGRCAVGLDAAIVEELVREDAESK